MIDLMSAFANNISKWLHWKNGVLNVPIIFSRLTILNISMRPRPVVFRCYIEYGLRFPKRAFRTKSRSAQKPKATSAGTEFRAWAAEGHQLFCSQDSDWVCHRLSTARWLMGNASFYSKRQIMQTLNSYVDVQVQKIQFGINYVWCDYNK